MRSERFWAAALVALLFTGSWVAGEIGRSRARSKPVRAQTAAPKDAALDKPDPAFPYIVRSGRDLDEEESAALARALYAAAYSKLTVGDGVAAFEGGGVKAPKQASAFWHSDEKLDGVDTTASAAAEEAGETSFSRDDPRAAAEGWLARAEFRDSVGYTDAGETGSAGETGDGWEGEGRGAALLEKLGVRSGELSGFDHGRRRASGAGKRGAGALGTAGAPETGAGKAHTQTLYINSKNADLFMDPEAMESAPDGFSEKDRPKVEVVYKLFGESKAISLAKGSDLMRGEQVTWSGIESEDGKWLQVEAGGISAWVRKEDLTGAGWRNWNPATAKAFEIGKLMNGKGLIQVAKEAESRVGDRYVWGASSPGQFDCSGLVHYAYRRYGMQLPRVSRDQKAAAQMITSDQMEPGDLVFTGNPVKHVMMYLGEGRLVEAMGRKYGVVTSSLSGRTSGGKAVYYGTFRHLLSNK